MTRSEFEQMAAQLRTEVLKVSTAFFGHQQDAEDAAQEAMVQLWRFCENIDQGRSVKALAVRVAKNCCVSIHRRRHDIFEAVDSRRSLLVADAAATPQQLLEGKDAQRLIDDVVALLQPRERQLFLMRQQEGLSTEEIAAATGIPRASVMSMVSMARKKVFQELTKRLKQ